MAQQVSQQYAEVLGAGTVNARVSQQYAEVLVDYPLNSAIDLPLIQTTI